MFSGEYTWLFSLRVDSSWVELSQLVHILHPNVKALCTKCLMKWLPVSPLDFFHDDLTHVESSWLDPLISHFVSRHSKGFTSVYLLHNFLYLLLPCFFFWEVTHPPSNAGSLEPSLLLFFKVSYYFYISFPFPWETLLNFIQVKPHHLIFCELGWLI